MNRLDFLTPKTYRYIVNTLLIGMAFIFLSACDNNSNKTTMEDENKSKPFIAIWKTDQATPKSSWHRETFSPLTIELPLNFSPIPLEDEDEIKPNWRIDWGDGSETNSSTYNGYSHSHTYKTKGTYTIKIYADSLRINLFDSDPCHVEECTDGPMIHDTDDQKLLFIEQWGTAKWTGFEDAFNGCANLVVKATDTPNLSKVDNL